MILKNDKPQLTNTTERVIKKPPQPFNFPKRAFAKYPSYTFSSPLSSPK